MYGIPQERDSQSTAGRRRYTANGETPSLPLPPFQCAMALDVGDEGVVFGKPVD